jgi:hypothetical protein
LSLLGAAGQRQPGREYLDEVPGQPPGQSRNLIEVGRGVRRVPVEGDLPVQASHQPLSVGQPDLSAFRRNVSDELGRFIEPAAEGGEHHLTGGRHHHCLPVAGCGSCAVERSQGRLGLSRPG